MGDGGAEPKVPGGARWTSGTVILFWDKYRMMYGRADSLAAPITVCNWKGATVKLLIKPHP